MTAPETVSTLSVPFLALMVSRIAVALDQLEGVFFMMIWTGYTCLRLDGSNRSKKQHVALVGREQKRETPCADGDAKFHNNITMACTDLQAKFKRPPKCGEESAQMRKNAGAAAGGAGKGRSPKGLCLWGI